jgi:16S rRNA (guanine966-N2)-methyltransferase
VEIKKNSQIVDTSQPGETDVKFQWQDPAFDASQTSYYYVRVVQENLERCGLTDRAAVLRTRIPEGLWGVRKALGQPCDLVFLDPPYAEEGKEQLLVEFQGFAFLKEHARIVFEHARNDAFSCVPAGFVVEDERKYGDTLLTFLNYQPGEERDDGR